MDCVVSAPTRTSPRPQAHDDVSAQRVCRICAGIEASSKTLASVVVATCALGVASPRALARSGGITWARKHQRRGGDHSVCVRVTVSAAAAVRLCGDYYVHRYAGTRRSPGPVPLRSDPFPRIGLHVGLESTVQAMPSRHSSDRSDSVEVRRRIEQPRRRNNAHGARACVE